MAASLRPEPGEYAAYYEGYVGLVPEADPLPVLAAQPAELKALLGDLEEATQRHRYAEGKWSVREVVGHVNDAERIFGCRALRIARGDATPLPGFDQNAYVAPSAADTRPMDDLLGEFEALRLANVLMLRALPDEALVRMGIASGYPISVRALAYILAGHVRHHAHLLRERYLPDQAPTLDG